ncbi:MAG TPA: DUF4097 family beta strand repeat-containing protein [Opitutaceae bacterium]|nr:DUF4097 family beta strand repeat-containing protein [Opitutaceae bacterium]
MKLLSHFAAVAMAAAAVSSYATIDRTVDKTFTVSGAGTLRLETQGGGITVNPGPDGVVKITARERIRASSDAQADELLKDLDLAFDQSGNDVRAIAKYGGHRPSFHFGSWPPVNVDFTVTVPAAYALDLHTSGGGITVGDIAGPVFARTSGGGIHLGKLGGKVDAHTSGGGIHLDEARGEAKLDTSGGSIDVGRVAGPADLSTSGGGIRIDAVMESLRAHTSGGSVRAKIVGPLKGDCSLSTSGGGIRVSVGKTAAFRLDASTSGGGVDANGLSITLEGGNHGRNRLAGAVNGGGPLLKLRTSGGNIRIDTE